MFPPSSTKIAQIHSSSPNRSLLEQELRVEREAARFEEVTDGPTDGEAILGSKEFPSSASTGMDHDHLQVFLPFTNGPGDLNSLLLRLSFAAWRSESVHCSSFPFLLTVLPPMLVLPGDFHSMKIKKTSCQVLRATTYYPLSTRRLEMRLLGLPDGQIGPTCWTRRDIVTEDLPRRVLLLLLIRFYWVCLRDRWYCRCYGAQGQAACCSDDLVKVGSNLVHCSLHCKF